MSNYKKKIKHFDTFSGAGGFSLALRESIGEENIETIGFSEIDKFAIQTYEKNFPGTLNLGSISEIDILSLPDFDLLTGGFPCQDVSLAGKQNLEGGRTVLVEYLLQIIEKKQPQYFVFENVKGLESIFNRIEGAGYGFSYKILNTKDFGIPQNRERVFIVGELTRNTGYFNFPQGEQLKVFLKDILEEEVDEKYYMTNEQYNKLNYDSIKRIYDSIPPSLNTSQEGHRQHKILFNKYNNRIMDKISGTLGTCAGFTNKQGYMVGYNTRSREFIGTGFKDICPALCARDYRDYKDPKQTIKNLVIRKLTPLEYERLQGFPDNFTDICSNTQRYKQMGNAISIPPVKAIFDNLLK